jgi:hypothetical protein
MLGLRLAQPPATLHRLCSRVSDSAVGHTAHAKKPEHDQCDEDQQPLFGIEAEGGRDQKVHYRRETAIKEFENHGRGIRQRGGRRGRRVAKGGGYHKRTS